MQTKPFRSTCDILNETVSFGADPADPKIMERPTTPTPAETGPGPSATRNQVGVRGGTVLTTKSVADTEALASRGASRVNLSLEFTSEAWEVLGDLVAQRRLEIPPITRSRWRRCPR